MNMRLLWMALDSDLYRDKPCAKLLLLSMCNFAREDGECFGSNATLSRHACCTPQHVRRLKKTLEADDLIKITVGGGRGRASKYKINMQLLAELTHNKQEHEVPLLMQERGTSGTLKGNMRCHKGEHGGAPISKKDIKRARARDARGINTDLTRSANQEVGRHDLGDGASVFREMIEQKFGAAFSRSWIDQCSIDASSEGVEILAPLAFVKSRIENQCSAWLYENEARVVFAKVDEIFISLSNKTIRDIFKLS